MRSQTRLLQEALDASVTLAQDPVDRTEALGAVVDRLVAQRHPYAGRVTVLFAETALAAERTSEIASRAAALRGLAAALATGSEEQRALSVRLRLCLADVDGRWHDLLDAARQGLPNDQVALVLARYARDRAWKADPKAAEDSWREAVEQGCLAGLQEDAADWLYAQRELHVRYGPIDESLEEPHHLAQALRAAGGGRRLLAQRRNPREVGLDRLQHDQLPPAADALRRYLRISLVTGSWTSELDAHQLLGSLFARADEPAIAIHHLIRSGSGKQARQIAADVGDRYIDVTEQLQRPAPWERAVAYQVIAVQGDLVPDDHASAILDHALADIDAILAGDAYDTPFFGPGVYSSAYQVAAALADGTDEAQARRVLDHLRPLVARGPSEYRPTDDAHVDALVAIASVHDGLRQDALDQLLSLLSGDGGVADRVLARARPLFEENQDVIIPQLRQLAVDGSPYAARALGILGFYDDEQRDRGRQALDRWLTPRKRQPGVVTFGTGAIPDSLLVRAQPAADRAIFATRMLKLAVDPDEPGWNRREFLQAAINLAHDLDPSDRAELSEQAMSIARGHYPPSLADQGPVESNHPLSRFRVALAVPDLRALGLEFAAVMAQTPQQAVAIQDLALQLLSGGDDHTIHMVAVALSQLRRDFLTLDARLFAAHPHASLRVLAAIRWVQNPASDPELGLALARDPDPRVRRMLAEAISKSPDQTSLEPIGEVLRQDSRRSIRRSLQARPSP